MSDTVLQALLYAVILILPLSALAARRLPIATAAKYAIAWLGIFLIALLAIVSFT